MIRALDTNIIVDLLRGKDAKLAARYLDARPTDYAIPEMVRAELLYGAALSSRPRENRGIVDKFLAPLRPLSFGGEASVHWAEIRAALQKSGSQIGANDLVIAATARACSCTLVTRNTSEFSRVPGLAVEEW
jgi:tRNA(fMet)-specific endonuclease VapC